MPFFAGGRVGGKADYFEECLSIRECLEFYLSAPEFYIIKSDPTADGYLAEDDDTDFVVGDGPAFGYARALTLSSLFTLLSSLPLFLFFFHSYSVNQADP